MKETPQLILYAIGGTFVLLLGLMGDRPPDLARAIDPGWGEGAPFFIWDSPEALA